MHARVEGFPRSLCGRLAREDSDLGAHAVWQPSTEPVGCGTCRNLVPAAERRYGPLAEAPAPDPAAWLRVRAKGDGSIRLAPTHSLLDLCNGLLAAFSGDAYEFRYELSMEDGTIYVASPYAIEGLEINDWRGAGGDGGDERRFYLQAGRPDALLLRCRRVVGRPGRFRLQARRPGRGE